VRAVWPTIIEVTFDDAISQVIDLRKVLYGELFGPLRNPELFAQVTVDPEVHTVVWPNGADFDPETLHDWPDRRADFIAMAQNWRAVRSAS
jgi:hypothetical protein